jgi:hypothetical protein
VEFRELEVYKEANMWMGSGNENSRKQYRVLKEPIHA